MEIVVMIQGDEPMITPEMIDDAIQPLTLNTDVKITNLVADFHTVEEFEDPNEVKVVLDLNSNALYFSREPIPSMKKGVIKVPMKKQVCIIPFQRDFLIEYNNMPQTPLEIVECVYMMRLLEYGIPVKMVPTDVFSLAVDTQEDLDRVIVEMKSDKLIASYI
jgi:3-deoxy-manno-octulosonate cytidylyltransferase (CMP-KDO synthetase)